MTLVPQSTREIDFGRLPYPSKYPIKATCRELHYHLQPHCSKADGLLMALVNQQELATREE